MDMEKVIKEQAEKIGRELTENERKAIEGIYTLTNALWLKQDQKANRLQVMSWLEGLVEDDWREYHSDSEVSNIAKAALEQLKGQEAVEPTLKKDKYGFFDWACGSCGAYMYHIYDGIDKAKEYAKYCRQCGKPVKWAES